MSVKEVLQALGSWGLTLDAGIPDEVLRGIGFFGHVAIVRGKVDVAAAGDALLAKARYVGVLRDELGKDGDAYSLGGVGMTVWLGDEDGKGQVLESKVVLTNATLTAAVTAVLPAAVHIGTIYALANPAARYTGTHRYEDPRTVLTTICEAFGVEWRVNGDATLDVGTQAQLYTAVPDSLVVRRGAGADLDLVALGGEFAVQQTAIDYTDRLLLMGQTLDEGDDPFVTAVATAPSVPYSDRWGNPVKRTRMVSESGQTTGSAPARAQLHLNRFNRTTTALKVTARDYELSGNFRVGDNTFVYDPDTGIVNAANQRDFRGQLLHPDVVRVSEVSWPITEDHTVAFRTGAGVWLDLTRWVRWESGSNELVVGDLPKSLTAPAGNPVRDRADALPSTATPNPPTGLQLATTSVVNPKGGNSALILAEWIAPTQNTDNTAVDLSHYLVQYRWTGRAPQWQSTVAGTTQIDVPVVIDLDYEVRVAAVGRNGKTSAFTAASAIHAAADATAPATPSDPVVSAYLGQLRITWDGLTATGTAMPPDFNRVEVHVSTATGFTPTDATRVDELATSGHSFATAPYGATRWVRLVAIDHTGNASSPSGSVSGESTWVNNADIAQMSITDALVANLSVGKLTAGIMTADVTISGRFATALTGARVELNSLGLQKRDASNALLVSITGAENLLTGIFKTALTGRRIEIGAGGAVGEMNMYAPDGKRSFVRAWTESGGVEAVQFGIEVPGAHSLWNRINYNSSVNGEYATYRSGTHEFVFDSTAPNGNGQFMVFQTTNRGATAGVLRLQIAAGPTSYRMTSTRHEYELGARNQQGWVEFAPHGRIDGAYRSPLLRFLTDNGGGDGGVYGADIKFAVDPDKTDPAVEIRNVFDTGYERLKASAFVVSSDRRGKTNIVDAQIDGLAVTKAIRLRRWQPADGPGPVLMGVVAQEAPPEILTSGGLAVDVMSVLAVHTDAIQKLAAQVAALSGSQ